MTETYRFSGPFPGWKDVRTRNKGIMAQIRGLKRKEAEDRNKLTPLYKTARFRRQSPEVQIQWLEEAGLLDEYRTLLTSR